LASFFMDISSEMVVNLVPLFLANVLGVRTNLIGLIEGVAEATASVLKVASGWWSDRVGSRKWLAVAGYTVSALSKPLYLNEGSVIAVAGARWSDRIGKGIRTAPRDALVADAVPPSSRGVAFGVQRAMDTAGALLGLLIALVVVMHLHAGAHTLGPQTFKTLVWLSLLPAVLAVVSLALGAQEVPARPAGPKPVSWRALGRPFFLFLLITGIFDLGNSSDAFIILRAQERGLNIVGILALLAAFNLVYAVMSIPAGRWSDRVGRRRLLVGGWLVYALIYLGLGLAGKAWQVAGLYVMYGVYYGLTYGTAKAMVADLVPLEVRGTAYGVYNAVMGVLDVPASVLAGVLWQGIGAWQGFGPGAPFVFGAAMALAATLLMLVWRPSTQ
jgi:MFS family permease